MFERDWARACSKEKFTSMLARENKGNPAGKSDKQAMQDVHDMLKKHYQVPSASLLLVPGGSGLRPSLVKLLDLLWLLNLMC